MRRPVLVHRAGQVDPERRELEAPCTAGGSRSDAVLLEGLAPGALRLEPCDAGLVVEAAAAGVRAGGRPLLPGARRLLRGGERVQVRGHVLALPEEGARAAALPGGTRAMASDLLRGASGGAPGRAGPHLLVLTGKDAGLRLPLGPEETLGRSRRATVRLADPRASRLHARLRLEPDGVTVEDLGARNGLRVNGVAVERQARALRPGDVLALGDTELALVVPWASGARAAPTGAEAPAASGPEPGPEVARGQELRRAAAALLALAALALALAGA